MERRNAQRDDASPADEVLELSHRMLEAAVAGDWRGLENLQAARERALAAFRRFGVRAEAAAVTAAALQRVSKVNQRIASLAVAERDAAAEGLRQLRLGKQAHKAYQAPGFYGN